MFAFLIIIFLTLNQVAIAQDSTTELETCKLSERKAREIGRKSSKAFLQKFQSALMGAIKKGGLTYAVSYCNSNVPAIREEVKKNLPDGIDFKRTSRKVRNPSNKPDHHETVALKHFEANNKNKDLKNDFKKKEYLQKVLDNKQIEYRYYKPIKIKAVCLSCHGEKSMIDPEVLTILNEKYPKDQATGYKLNDLRGVLNVSIPLALLKEEKK